MTLSIKANILRLVRPMWARHQHVTRIRRELDASSDRALGEMGIARGDIDAIAHAGDNHG